MEPIFQEFVLIDVAEGTFKVFEAAYELTEDGRLEVVMVRKPRTEFNSDSDFSYYDLGVWNPEITGENFEYIDLLDDLNLKLPTGLIVADADQDEYPMISDCLKEEIEGLEDLIDGLYFSKINVAAPLFGPLEDMDTVFHNALVFDDIGFLRSHLESVFASDPEAMERIRDFFEE